MRHLNLALTQSPGQRPLAMVSERAADTLQRSLLTALSCCEVSPAACGRCFRSTASTFHLPIGHDRYLSAWARRRFAVCVRTTRARSRGQALLGLAAGAFQPTHFLREGEQ